MIKLLFFLPFILFACNNPDKYAHYDHDTLERISKLASIEPVPPPVISFIPVFMLSGNDSVAITTFPRLKQIFSANYTQNYKTFDDFLFAALNRKSKPSINARFFHLYDQVFKIDTAISFIYKSESINGLIKRYVVLDKDRYTLRREKLTLNEINSISFYFFIHQFIRQDDDYNASIHFNKLSSVLGDLGKTN